MIAGIVLLALGGKKTTSHVDEPLATVPAVALCGGVALDCRTHAFRWRNVHVHRPRSWPPSRLLALIPLAREADASTRSRWSPRSAGLIVYEVTHYREARERIRANPSGTLAEMRGTS